MLSVAPKIITIVSAKSASTKLIDILIINRNLNTCLNTFKPFSSSPAPKFFETSAPPPTANIVAIPNSIIVSGITIVTAASALSPTPCPTNMPSIIVYSDETNMASAEGIA